MGAAFVQVRSHSSTPAAASRYGRVVLSCLQRGECLIARPCVSIKFVLLGEERYELDGRIQVLRPGEMLIADTGAASRVVLPQRAETRGLCLYLPAGLPETPVPGPERLEPPALILPAAATPLGRMINAAARGLVERPEAGSRVAQDLVERAARGLGRLLARQHALLGRLDAVKPTTRAEILRRLEHARAHLHGTMQRQVSLGELAALAGMSQFHLARSFTEAFGLPPIAYHRRLRLDFAADELRRGRISPSEAACALGFPELSSFTRAFKRQHGLPPSLVAGARADRN